MYVYSEGLRFIICLVRISIKAKFLVSGFSIQALLTFVGK